MYRGTFGRGGPGEPFPRASPGVPSMAMALRLGAGPAKAAPTRRSVRRIFPAAHVAGKNDSDSFRLAPETRKGCPLPGPFPGGRGTGVPGQLPASVGSTCNPPGREAASAAGGPLQRQDGSPRSAACFYRKCLLSAWPRSDFGGEGAASAAGRGAPVGCLLLLEIPAVRLAAKRLRRREGRCSGRTGAPGQLPASIGSTCCPPGREATSAAGAFGAVSLRLPCVKGAGAHRATEGLFAETSPEALSPGNIPA